MSENTEQYGNFLSNSAEIQYKVPISQPRAIWEMKFDDCLERLEDKGSPLYSDIEDMKDKAEFHPAEYSSGMQYMRGVMKTVDRFESALDQAEDMFKPDSQSYEFSHHSETEELSEDDEDFWWVIHHLQTMKNKGEHKT